MRSRSELGYASTKKAAREDPLWNEFRAHAVHKPPLRGMRPAIWENMLGTVYALSPERECKYFDYNYDEAVKFTGYPDRAGHVRVAKVPPNGSRQWIQSGTTEATPRPGKLVWWVMDQGKTAGVFTPEGYQSHPKGERPQSEEYKQAARELIAMFGNQPPDDWQTPAADWAAATGLDADYLYDFLLRELEWDRRKNAFGKKQMSPEIYRLMREYSELEPRPQETFDEWAEKQRAVVTRFVPEQGRFNFSAKLLSKASK